MIAYLLDVVLVIGFLAAAYGLINLVFNAIRKQRIKAWVILTCAGLIVTVAGYGALVIADSKAEQYMYRAMTSTDIDESINEYSKAIQLDPFNHIAYTNRGSAYHEKGEYRQAISDFTKAIELKYYYWEAYSGRGKVYTDQGDFDKAISDFTKAIELNFKYDLIKAWDYYHRGKLHADIGELNNAISDFTKAIELNFSYAEAYYARGLAYKEDGRKIEAIADFNKFITLTNDSNLSELARQEIEELSR